jgi:hypothetical protein
MPPCHVPAARILERGFIMSASTLESSANGQDHPPRGRQGRGGSLPMSGRRIIAGPGDRVIAGLVTAYIALKAGPIPIDPNYYRHGRESISA